MNKLRMNTALLALLVVHTAWGQLTIERCWEKAEANYPLIRQRGLIEMNKNYSLHNAAMSYIPQLTVGGKATYQSEVIQLPIDIPGVEIPELNKYQYQVTVQLDQTVWDGGATSAQRKGARAQAEVDTKSLDVSVYGLRSQVSNLFIGSLLLQEQLEQVRLTEQWLQTNLASVRGRVENGVAQASDLDAMQVEVLNNKQRRQELESQARAYRRALSLMINEEIAPDERLVVPAVTDPSLATEVRRPELSLYEARRQLIDTQRSSLDVKNYPRIGLFAQAGGGSPGLNMFKTDFSTFALGGVKFSWSIGGLYTRHNEVRQLEINRQMIDLQQETFLWSLSQQTVQQREMVEKFRQSMAEDDEIIRLRQRIVASSDEKVKNGTMSMTEYLRDVNAEEQARQLRVLHRMQWLLAVYDLKLSINAEE